MRLQRSLTLGTATPLRVGLPRKASAVQRFRQLSSHTGEAPGPRRLWHYVPVPFSVDNDFARVKDEWCFDAANLQREAHSRNTRASALTMSGCGCNEQPADEITITRARARYGVQLSRPPRTAARCLPQLFPSAPGSRSTTRSESPS